jgi:uncharacterized protein (TIGR03083 family)
MEIARLYRDAHASFVELAGTFTDDDWLVPVPCCPGWAVRDVLSHVAGVTLDIAAGRVDGAATDPWTAAQVERWRDTSVGELMGAWNEAIDPVADAIEAIGEIRPPLDCHVHEHDVRHALGRPGNRDSELIAAAVGLFGGGSIGRPVEVVFADGGVLSTPGDGPTLTLTGVTRFDVVRSRSGRRSADQVRAWSWSAPVTDDELAAWFMFGPNAEPIEE